MRDPSHFMRNWSSYIVLCSLPLSLPPACHPWQPVPVVFSKTAFRLRSEPAPLNIWRFHVVIVYEAHILTNWKSFQTWRPVLTLTLIMIMWHCDTFNIKYRLTFWLWPSLEEVWWFNGMMSVSGQGLTSLQRWWFSCWGWWCAAACSSGGCTAPGYTRLDRRWFLKYFFFEKFEEKSAVWGEVRFSNSRTLVVKTGCCAEMTPYKNQYLDIKCTGLNILLVKS